VWFRMSGLRVLRRFGLSQALPFLAGNASVCQAHDL
jgi:hypothetical protein